MFVGTYSATEIEADDKYKLLGGNDGTVIANVSEAGTLKGTRCYFFCSHLVRSRLTNVPAHHSITIRKTAMTQSGIDKLTINTTFKHASHTKACFSCYCHATGLDVSALFDHID